MVSRKGAKAQREYPIILIFCLCVLSVSREAAVRNASVVAYEEDRLNREDAKVRSGKELWRMPNVKSQNANKRQYPKAKIPNTQASFWSLAHWYLTARHRKPAADSGAAGGGFAVWCLLFGVCLSFGACDL